MRLVTAVSLCALVPSVASASNMTHPRTPVLWEGAPCMTLHDRSQGATFHLPYAIPFEDLEVTPDEVADSRRHQFFGFCRPHHPQDFLPTWITDADVQSAADKMLLEISTVEEDDILEHNPEWTDCWFRINTDAERREISQENADAGVDWDTTDVPAGVYTLYGYTYEPVFNVWWLRPGVMKLHDGDADAIGPAAAISTGELTPYRDETVTLEGCVDALEGTTFAVSWALVSAEEPEWIDYEGGLAIDGDAFSFDFTPPADLAGQSGMIRVVFTDPMDREYITYQADNILVIDADNPNSCDTGGSFIGNPCSDSSGTDAGSGDESTTGAGTSGESTAGNTATDTTPMQTGGDDGTDPKSCACTSDRGDTGWAWLVVLGGITLSRRRRR